MTNLMCSSAAVGTPWRQQPPSWSCSTSISTYSISTVTQGLSDIQQEVSLLPWSLQMPHSTHNSNFSL